MTYTEPYTRPPEHEPTPGWGQSLSAGAAGIALLHAAYAHADLADWATAHRWVAAMIREPVAAHPNASLFHGAPAVAFTLRTIHRQPGHAAYVRPLAVLDQHITALTRGRLDRAHERIDRGQLPQLREFDLINGLTGIGMYLLHTEHTELLHDVLAYLVRLVDPVTVDGQRLPGWWSGNGPADQPAPAWPGGHANLGIAHGIAGPLALLSTALRGGVSVPGQPDAIDRADAWLEDWRCGTPSRPWWPGMISRTEHTTGVLDQPGPQRPSWCYGTPGLTRARQLAALALDDQRRQRHAEHDLASCLADHTQLAQLRDDSLCHGWAGLIHTAWRASLDAEADSDLVRVVRSLHDRWNRRHNQPGPRMSDQHGMLEGAAGIALAHHAAGEPITTAWDACLLTAPPSPQPRHDHAHLEGIG